MSIRLYDSAWVLVEGGSEPLPVRKDRRNPANFHVGDYLYDVDSLPMSKEGSTPRILSILSLQQAREAGLRTDYNPDIGFP